jgi:hypothetical protein
VELVAVGPRHREIVGQGQGHLDSARAEVVRQELDHLLDDLVEPHLGALGRPLPCQCEEVAYDATAPVGAAADPLRPLDQRVVRRRHAEQMRLPDDDRQWVVQLVGHAGQQRAHRRDLLALQKALRPFLDHTLERAVVPLELEVQRARVEQVLDPEQHLEPVERLGQKVLGAGLERTLLRLGRRVRGQHQHRQEHVARDRELADDRDPVQVRHHQVEQDQVGRPLAVERPHLARVGRAADLAIAGLGQHALEESDVGRLVVDDEDPGLPEIDARHDDRTAPTSSSSRSARNWDTTSGLVR